MKKFLPIFFLIQHFVFCQPASFDFHSPQNIKKFADNLFCDNDYLRAIEQYQLLPTQSINDTISFKQMFGFSELKLYDESNKIFGGIFSDSKLYPDCYLLTLKNQLLLKPEPLTPEKFPTFSETQLISYQKLITISKLYSDKPEISEKVFIENFEKDDTKTLSKLYQYKFEPPYKSSAVAGILSAIIPGSGKMYVGEWGDGIVALLISGLFAYLAYDNFKADHSTRAWIFTGLGAFFYAGNIYGSIASAQLFNAKIDFNFSNGLKLFLEQENYFLPEYDFCN